MLFFIPLIYSKELIYSPFNDLATISFDEGPSKNIPAILSILNDEQVIATFYFTPSKITDKSLIETIINDGHTIGLAIIEDLDEVDPDDHIKEQKKLFIKATGYKPKFIRLPRIYYSPEHVNIAELNGMIVTRPNLDSEDTDLESFMEPFTEFVLGRNEPSLSVVFHDRIGKMVENLREAIGVIRERYQIRGIGEFYWICARMVKSEYGLSEGRVKLNGHKNDDEGIGEKINNSNGNNKKEEKSIISERNGKENDKKNKEDGESTKENKESTKDDGESTKIDKNKKDKESSNIDKTKEGEKSTEVGKDSKEDGESTKIDKNKEDKEKNKEDGEIIGIDKNTEDKENKGENSLNLPSDNSISKADVKFRGEKNDDKNPKTDLLSDDDKKRKKQKVKGDEEDEEDVEEDAEKDKKKKGKKSAAEGIYFYYGMPLLLMLSIILH